MAPRKKRTTRPKKAPKKSNFIAPLFFLGLIIVAAAGWYISFADKTQTEPQNYVSNITPSQRLSSPNTQIPSVIPEQKVVPQSPQPVPIPAPVVMQQVPIPQKPTAATPLLQNKEPLVAQPLPPSVKNTMQDSRGPQDSAKILFAQRRTVIYEEPNNNAKQIAIVERGQEMRSYMKQGSWHKVTVPRAGIIGWAHDSSFR